MAAHRAATDTCLSCRTIDRDLHAADRTIAENPDFTIAVPFAPNWPYEVHVRARRHGARRLPDLTTDERADLARALRTVVRISDRFDPAAGLSINDTVPEDSAAEFTTVLTARPESPDVPSPTLR